MILVPGNRVLEFTKKVKWYKAVEPVEVDGPSNFYVLPESVLDDPEIIEALPNITSLNKQDKSEIIFKTSEL
jgi:hypothetical protein